MMKGIFHFLVLFCVIALTIQDDWESDICLSTSLGGDQELNNIDSVNRRRYLRSANDESAEMPSSEPQKSLPSTTIINQICGDIMKERTRRNVNPTNNTIMSSTPTSHTAPTNNVNEKLLCALLQDFANEKTSMKVNDFSGGQYLPSDYNKFEAPTIKSQRKLQNGMIEFDEDPVECQVFLNVRNVVNFDDDNGAVTLDMDLILLWIDGNVLNHFSSGQQTLSAEEASRSIVLSPLFLKKIWTPDIYIDEVMSIEQPKVMGDTVTVVLTPQTGMVVYRSRFLAKLNCNMDFKYYPADTQSCTFTLKSFSYITARLKISWVLQGGTGVYLHGVSDPDWDYQIASFTSNDTYLDIGPASDPSVLYSSLQFTLMARRKIAYQLVQTYFASAFFVVVTWLCFLISPGDLDIRIAISMTTLLSLTVMFSSMSQTTPKVSYVKAIDIWMLANINLVFLALVGFSFTAWIRRRFKRMMSKREEEDSISDMMEDRNQPVYTELQTKSILRRYRRGARIVEGFGIYILSITYIIFSTLYWSWLLTESHYLNWSVNATFNNLDG